MILLKDMEIERIYKGTMNIGLQPKIDNIGEMEKKLLGLPIHYNQLGEREKKEFLMNALTEWIGIPIYEIVEKPSIKINYHYINNSA